MLWQSKGPSQKDQALKFLSVPQHRANPLSPGTVPVQAICDMDVPFMRVSTFCRRLSSKVSQGTNTAQSKPALTSRPNIRLALAIAWPDAPRHKLSMAETITSLPVRSSLTGPRSQNMVPLT